MPSVGVVNPITTVDPASQSSAPSSSADSPAVSPGPPVMGDLPLERVLTARLLASLPANLGQNYDYSG